MEACVIFLAPAGALMRWPLVGGQSLPRQPDEAADGSVGEAAGEQDGDSSTRVWMPVVEEIYSRGMKNGCDRCHNRRSIPQFRFAFGTCPEIASTDRYASLPTILMHSSSTSTATSASSLVTIKAGQIRMVLGPQPRNRTPRSKASSTMRSRSAAPYSLVTLSFTIST